jgi:DNA-binding response OmpR family regulator
VLSTEFSDEKKARAREAGATGWITKPFEATKLGRRSAACARERRRRTGRDPGIFFEECNEGLTTAEQGLSAMQAGDVSAETIAGVFRAVHSIKGGGARSAIPI